jgi:hypothetical protein
VICERLSGDEWVPETVAEALAMRSRRRRCIAPECHDESIVPYKQGKNGAAAHFEHHPWNEKCPLRDQTWEEERLAKKALREDGLSKEEARSAVKELKQEARARGTTFRKLIKRARGVGIDRKDFLERFSRDPDALLADIGSREQRP